MSVQLTVIDQTPIHGDRPPTHAPHTSLELAKACDTLGYHRYWLAEHHSSIQFAGPAPEILLTHIASHTKHMRIGSGGVMLTHYSPYKVAEVFRLLTSLFPGRIDLGVGRAPGGSQLSSAALAFPAHLSDVDHFPEQAAQLCAYLRNSFPAAHPFSQLHFPPNDGACPSLWMLGSGGGSAGLAGQLGMGLALARFIAPKTCTPAIFDHHNQALVNAGHDQKPQRLLALAVVCAETDEQARFIAGTAVYRKLMTGRGPREPLLSPEEVERRRQRMTAALHAEFDEMLESMIVGSASFCRAEILRLCKSFGTHEAGIVTVTHGFEDRLASYEHLAQALLAK